MRILKNNPIFKLLNAYLIDASQPSNISYLWNFGSLLALCLVIQIITGITLAMHYNSSVVEAFNSIEHIMRDVNNGWLIRYLHANTASAFFFLVYLHIGRGMYYGSYKSPRTLVWIIGTVILVVMIATAFLGYVLPYGQMSLWGATVITNLMSAIPWLGQDIVEFIWGGFSVNNATLNRFFSLHYVLPFLLAVLVLLHLISLHDKAGSGNPLGVGNYVDRITFSPYYTFKDLITIFIFIFILSSFVCFVPNLLGDSDNYVMANPMQTPPAIVPEWYLLPFYAILRSIPNKLLGVIAMFSALLIIISMSFLDVHKFRGFQYKPLNKIVFYIFIVIFLSLLRLGAKHVESPYIELGQIFTSLYFMYFLVFIPFFNLLEYYLEYYLDFKNLTTVPSPHAFVNLPQKQSIIPSYFQLRFLAHISKYSSIYAFFISMFVIIIFKLNFDSTYIVYAMDSQNDNQSTETTQQNNPAINVTQEQADKLTELQKEYDNLTKELDAYYKKIGKISYVDVEDAVNQINEAKEEGDKLVIAKHQAATTLFNYKELLKSISK